MKTAGCVGIVLFLVQSIFLLKKCFESWFYKLNIIGIYVYATHINIGYEIDESVLLHCLKDKI